MKPFYEQDGITIYCGDCREILPGLEPGSVKLLWTDPPYGHQNQNGDLQAARIGIRGARQAAAIPIANDDPTAMREVVDASLRLAVPLLHPDCCCCCCCCCGGGGPSPTFAWTANRMDSDGLRFFHAVVWDKSGRGHGLGWRFRRDYEFVMVAHRTGGRLAWADDVAVPNIWFVQPTDNANHPNEKPVELVSKFITLTTTENDLILDPFGGSGTTAIAAKQTGRRCIVIEQDESYCEIAARRLSQGILNFSGKEAK